MEDKFIQLFTEILEREERLKLDDKLEEIEGWDSLAALAVVSMIDDEYGITMSGKDLEKMQTVKDIFEYIKKKQTR